LRRIGGGTRAAEVFRRLREGLRRRLEALARFCGAVVFSAAEDACSGNGALSLIGFDVFTRVCAAPISWRTIETIAVYITCTNSTAKLEEREDFRCEHVDRVPIALSAVYCLMIHVWPFVA
jgi:hypothetical protein